MEIVTCKLAKHYKFNQDNPSKDIACKDCRNKAKRRSNKLLRKRKEINRLLGKTDKETNG